MDELVTFVRSRRHILIGLALALALCWFIPLGWRLLLPTDEGRYAEMAREMLLSADWVTPRYNGYKYFEKPPLQTWVNALTFACFGIGEWQARLYTALTGFAGVLLVGYTGWRVFNAAVGVCAAIVLASAPYWLLMGHFNSLDMGLSFWMEASLCAMLLAQRPSLPARQVRGWMCAAWAAMACAILSKGLAGLILPGGALILYSLFTRDAQVWKRLHLASGIAVCLLIAAPWFVMVQARNPDFLDFFFVTQQFRRYLTPEQHRPGPLYFFVPVLLIGFLPWLSIAARGARRALHAPAQCNGFAPTRLLLAWVVLIFVFFSLSHSKLVSYVLPSAPALALLLGHQLATMTRPALYRHLRVYLLILLLAAAGATVLGWLGDARHPQGLYLAYRRWLWTALGTAALFTLAALWAVRPNAADAAGDATRNAGRRLAAISAHGFAWVLLALIAGTGHNVFGQLSSGAALAEPIKATLARMPADTPFYSIDVLDHTLPFYVGHTMTMVQQKDELAFGIAAEPSKWVPTVAQWMPRWRSARYALALMSPQWYDKLLAQGLPMRVIARDARRVVVEKP